MNNFLGTLTGLILAAGLLGCMVLREGDNLTANNLVSSPSTGLVDRHAYSISGMLFAVVALSLVSAAFTVPYLYRAMRLIKQEVNAGMASAAAGWAAQVVVDVIAAALAIWPMAVVALPTLPCPTSRSRKLKARLGLRRPAASARLQLPLLSDAHVVVEERTPETRWSRLCSPVLSPWTSGDRVPPSHSADALDLCQRLRFGPADEGLSSQRDTAARERPQLAVGADEARRLQALLMTRDAKLDAIRKLIEQTTGKEEAGCVEPRQPLMPLFIRGS